MKLDSIARSRLTFSSILPKRIITLCRVCRDRSTRCRGRLQSASLRRFLHHGSCECEKRKEFQLSSEYYKGDRSMRESGFDVTFRFGPFGDATQHYAPVCLNSLLYKTEKDMEQISRWLGHEADAEKWNQRAEKRKQLITRYLWDDAAGFFFDYNVATGQRSSYRYATTLYPLWAGLATAEQAKRVVKNLAGLRESRRVWR